MADTATEPNPLQAWLAPVAAGAIALGIGQFVPLISPLLIALILGAVVVNTPLRDTTLLAGHASTTRLLLRVGVVLLGLRLPLQDIVALGLPGIAVIVSTVVVTYTATCWFGDRLGIERGLVTLIASGFSICGASAIAAVEGGIKRRNEDVALAIAMVTIFGSAMIVLLPLASGALGMTVEQHGVWAGASIHEVAQVVAAASTAGVAAVAIATTIKLGRVSLLGLAYLAARHRAPDTDATAHAPLIPWFVIGFVVAAGIRSADFLPASVLEVTDVITTLLLACAMFGLGLGMQVRALFPVPLRVLGLSASSTIVAATVSLAGTLLLF